jgi:hypothetical protein
MSRAPVVTLLALATALGGCITTYREFPEDKLGLPRQRGHVDQRYTFTMADGSMAGGYESLRDVLLNRSPYRRVTQSETVATEGVHVNVRIDSIPPTPAAIVGGYLSVSLLTLLPAWSTRDGYHVFFHVYRDGREVDTYDYIVRRKVFLWIVLLPLAWVNAFTYSEGEAFEAVGLQFFEDARRHFVGPGTPQG